MTDGRLSPVMQLGYLVENIDEAMQRWLKLGVGPFFVTRHPKYTVQDYRGESHFCDFSAAFAYTGDVQLELIEQHDDTPSAFLEFKAVHGYGLHHLGILSRDLKVDAQILAGQNGRPVHRMVSVLGVETVFYDLEQPGGALIELIQTAPLIEDGYAQMKQATLGWAGAGQAIYEF